MFATAMISRGNQFLREVHLRAGSMEQAGFPRELEKWGSAASRVGFGRLGNGGSLWGLGLSCGLWECGCWFGSGEARAGKGEEWHEWEASTRKRQHVWESPTPRFSPEGELFESAEGVSPACACCFQDGVIVMLGISSGADICCIMTTVSTYEVNMVLTALAVAFGGLILAVVVLLGLAILCHPLWVVRWTQKLQPHVLYVVPTQEKIVALTLDDGPHQHITPYLLDTLKENDSKATWFIIGNHMNKCPEVVERIHAEGHEVANHMMDDVASWTLSKGEFEKQLIRCDDLLTNFFRHNSSGSPIKWFRPGHGFYNPQIIETCNKHGYRVALGSLYPMDHMFEKQAKLLVRNLLWRIHPGAIIILHDRVPQVEQTPEVLRLLLPELRKRGYKIVTLSELEESVSNPEDLRPQEERPLLSQSQETSAPFEAHEN